MALMFKPHARAERPIKNAHAFGVVTQITFLCLPCLVILPLRENTRYCTPHRAASLRGMRHKFIQKIVAHGT